MTRPERVVDTAKIDFGTRTRFISEPWKPSEVMDWSVVWVKKPNTRYDDRK